MEKIAGERIRQIVTLLVKVPWREEKTWSDGVFVTGCWIEEMLGVTLFGSRLLEGRNVRV